MWFLLIEPLIIVILMLLHPYLMRNLTLSVIFPFKTGYLYLVVQTNIPYCKCDSFLIFPFLLVAYYIVSKRNWQLITSKFLRIYVLKHITWTTFPDCQKEIEIKKASGYTHSNYDILIMTFLWHFMLTFTVITISQKNRVK